MNSKPSPLKFIAALCVCGTVAVAARPDSSPPPSASEHTAPQAAAGECPCGCATGGVCTCPNCPCQSQGIVEAIEELSARLDELERPQYALNVPDLTPEISEPIQEEPTPSPRLYTDDGYLTPAGVVAWIETNGHRDHWSFPGGNDSVSEHIEHMIAEHGWERWQLDGLTYEQLERLHSADHDGIVGPRSRVEVAVAMADAEGIPVYYRNGRYEWRGNGTTYYVPSVTEGRTYNGGRYRYVNGRMVEIEVSRSTTVTRPPVVIQSYGNSCPGGNCNRPSMNFRRRGRW